jgi:hypothetical protein
MTIETANTRSKNNIAREEIQKAKKVPRFIIFAKRRRKPARALLREALKIGALFFSSRLKDLA